MFIPRYMALMDRQGLSPCMAPINGPHPSALHLFDGFNTAQYPDNHMEVQVSLNSSHNCCGSIRSLQMSLFKQGDRLSGFKRQLSIMCWAHTSSVHHLGVVCPQITCLFSEPQFFICKVRIKIFTVHWADARKCFTLCLEHSKFLINSSYYYFQMFVMLAPFIIPLDLTLRIIIRLIGANCI